MASTISICDYIIIFNILFYIVIPIEFVIMLGWWFWQSVQWSPSTWWNPLSIYSMGGVVIQWLIVIVIGFIFNQKFVNLIKKNSPE